MTLGQQRLWHPVVWALATRNVRRVAVEALAHLVRRHFCWLSAIVTLQKHNSTVDDGLPGCHKSLRDAAAVRG